MSTTYYDILKVDKKASKKEVKQSYRDLAKKYHPDRNRAPNAEENFKILGQAYEVLVDTTKRNKYDQLLASGRSYRPQKPRYANPRQHYRRVYDASTYTKNQLRFTFMFSILGVLFSLLIFVDYFLPRAISEETVEYIQGGNWAEPLTEHIYTLEGTKFPIDYAYSEYFVSYPEVIVERTKIFAIKTGIRSVYETETLVEANYSIYKPGIFFPIGLLLVGLMGIIFKKKPHWNFSSGVVCVVLSTFIVFFMYGW